MATLTQNAILVTVRDRAKEGLQESKGNYFQKLKILLKKIQNGRLDQKCYLSNGER